MNIQSACHDKRFESGTGFVYIGDGSISPSILRNCIHVIWIKAWTRGHGQYFTRVGVEHNTACASWLPLEYEFIEGAFYESLNKGIDGEDDVFAGYRTLVNGFGVRNGLPKSIAEKITLSVLTFQRGIVPMFNTSLSFSINITKSYQV